MKLSPKKIIILQTMTTTQSITNFLAGLFIGLACFALGYATSHANIILIIKPLEIERDSLANEVKQLEFYVRHNEKCKSLK